MKILKISLLVSLVVAHAALVANPVHLVTNSAIESGQASNSITKIINVLSSTEFRNDLVAAAPGLAVGAGLSVAGWLACGKVKDTLIKHQETILQAITGMITLGSLPYVYSPVKELFVQYPKPMMGAALAVAGMSFGSYLKEKVEKNAVFFAGGISALAMICAYDKLREYQS